MIVQVLSLKGSHIDFVWEPWLPLWVPHIPTSQSSAYLTYVNLMNWGFNRVRRCFPLSLIDFLSSFLIFFSWSVVLSFALSVRMREVSLLYIGLGISLRISELWVSFCEIRFLIYTSNSWSTKFDRRGAYNPPPRSYAWGTPTFGYMNVLLLWFHSIYPAFTSFQYRLISLGSEKVG